MWRQLIADIERRDWRTLYRADAPFDLAESPLPLFDLLGEAPRPRYTLQTQRGCPLACEFCGASRLLGVYRAKPTENIERELAAICRRTQCAVIELADDNTFVARRDGERLLAILQAAGVRYFTECDWRLAASLARSAAESLARAAASDSRAASFAFSASLVQTLVQTDGGVDASVVSVPLTSHCPLLCKLGVEGSSPFVSIFLYNPVAAIVGSRYASTGTPLTSSHGRPNSSICSIAVLTAVATELLRLSRVGANSGATKSSAPDRPHEGSVSKLANGPRRQTFGR